MSDLKFAALGAGFWARFQLSGWRELDGVRCVAICDPNRSKAERLATDLEIPAVYDDPEEMLREQQDLDFVDVVCDVDSHAPMVHLAASHKLSAVCQKPLAPDYKIAEGMVKACREAGVQLLVNENFRWQTPIREFQQVLGSGVIGRPFRGRIDFNSGFPVFRNQPFLKELEQFIITDLGSHTLDLARFLFGEAKTLYCQTRKVHKDIQGEDVATIMLEMDSATVLVQMAYAENYLERDRFPETYIFVEGDQGSAELGPDFWIRVTTASGTHLKRHAPPRYDWADPAYDVIHSSIVPCQANLLQALQGKGEAETTGADNLKTVKLVFSSYDSADRNGVVAL